MSIRNKYMIYEISTYLNRIYNWYIIDLILYFFEWLIFISLASVLMEHFLEGIAPLRHWYLNPIEKRHNYKSSVVFSQLTKALSFKEIFQGTC